MRYLLVYILDGSWYCPNKKNISCTTDCGSSLILSPVKVVWHFEQRTIKHFIWEFILHKGIISYKLQNQEYCPTFCSCNTIESVLTMLFRSQWLNVWKKNPREMKKLNCPSTGWVSPSLIWIIGSHLDSLGLSAGKFGLKQKATWICVWSYLYYDVEKSSQHYLVWQV
jgi:hypothetical protein